LQKICIKALDLCTKVKPLLGAQRLLRSNKTDVSQNLQVIDFIELFILPIGWAI
jgi:hypothetical protein